jgi:hypothetical protein
MPSALSAIMERLDKLPAKSNEMVEVTLKRMVLQADTLPKDGPPHLSTLQADTLPKDGPPHLFNIKPTPYPRMAHLTCSTLQADTHPRMAGAGSTKPIAVRIKANALEKDGDEVGC